jgi:hypothetical protein
MPKHPLSQQLLSCIVQRLQARGGLIDIRDTDFYLLAWFGMLRGGEAVACNWEDVHFPPRASCCISPFPKHQPGEGQWVFLAALPGSPLCPMTALRAWQQASCRTEGPVFTSYNSAARLAKGTFLGRLKRLLAELQELPHRSGLHTLRWGGATAAAKTGVSWSWSMAGGGLTLLGNTCMLTQTNAGRSAAPWCGGESLGTHM